MRTAVRITCALLGLLALALAVGAGSGTSRTAASPANLLVNGNAEAGPGATDNSTVDVPGWTRTAGAFTAVAYGSPGSPTAADGPPDAGRNFFAGGSGTSVSSAEQTVDVSGSAAAIDAGRGRVTLAAWLGGWAGQADSARVDAQFLGTSGAPIGSVSIGPVTASQRNSQTKLLPVGSGSVAVPVGTRKIRVVITATRAEGVYNDGYADSLSLVLTEASTAPATIAGTYSWSVKGRRSGSQPVISVFGRGRFKVDARGRVRTASGTLDVTFDRRSGPDELWRLQTKVPGGLRLHERSSMAFFRVEAVDAHGPARVKCAADPIGSMMLDVYPGGGTNAILELRRLCEVSYVGLDTENRSTALRASIRKIG